MYTLTVPQSVSKQPICCPQCNTYLGQTMGSVFCSQSHRRVIVGPVPAFIVCDQCRGVWRNPEWDVPSDVTGLLAVYRALPMDIRPARMAV